MSQSLVKIFGERNSGTNLLRQIISRNSTCRLWPGTVRELKASSRTAMDWPSGNADLEGHDAVLYRESILDSVFEHHFDLCLGWKHAAPDRERMMLNERYQDTSFVVVSKNPYAWLLSMHRNPHHNLLMGNMLSFSEFLRKPWLTTRRDNTAGVFQNPIELWNYKCSAYAELAKFTNVSFFRYEDILENPLMIFSQAGIPLNVQQSLDVPWQSMKGDSATFETYRVMYKERFWLSIICDKDKEIINQCLDLDVMKYLGYCICQVG